VNYTGAGAEKYVVSSTSAYLLVDEFCFADCKKTIDSDIFVPGRNIRIEAETIEVTGATLSTSFATPGNITLDANHIAIGDDAKLLAESTIAGGAGGKISIEAVDDRARVTALGFANVDLISTDITIGQATIKGGDLEIIATADSQHLVSEGDFNDTSPGAAYGAGVLDGVLGFLEGLSVIAAVAYSESTAKITIDSPDPALPTLIDVDNLTVWSSANAATSAAPFGKALGVAIGITKTNARVSIGNAEITAQQDATVRTVADQNVDVAADTAPAKGVGVALAVSVVDSKSRAEIGQDAVLTVGGNLFVQGETVDRNRTLARTVSGADGVLAVSVAVSRETGYTSAFLDGVADVGGNLNVTAKQLKEEVETERLILIPTAVNGVNASASTGTDFTGTIVDDAEGAVLNLVPIVEMVNAVAESGVKKSPVRGAASVAVNSDSNTTEARIGDGNASQRADVEADGFVSVTSTIDNRPEMSVTSSTQPPKKKKGGFKKSAAGAAVSVLYGNYANDAMAYIAGDADLDAKETITVSSAALNQIDPTTLWGANLAAPFNKDNLQPGNKSSDGTVLLDAGDTVEIDKPEHGDEGATFEYIGPDGAAIDLANEDYADTLKWKEVDLGGDAAQSFIATLTTYLDGNLGLNNNLFDSWTQAVAAGQKTVSFGGAITVWNLTHDSAAEIRDGANINQDPDGVDPNAPQGGFRTGDQNVVVEASSVNQAINLGGNFQTLLDGLQAKPKKWTKDLRAYRPFGGGDTDGAVGATVLVFNYTNDAESKIEDNVRLFADSLHVDASNVVLGVGIGASGGKSKSFGLNGVVQLSTVENTTRAQIENDSQIVVGSASVEDSDPPVSASVEATDDTILVNVAGSITVSKSVGVGGSVGLNEVTRDTAAWIGNRANQKGPRAGSWSVRGGRCRFVGQPAGRTIGRRGRQLFGEHDRWLGQSLCSGRFCDGRGRCHDLREIRHDRFRLVDQRGLRRQ
jgi:hypothetical protein